MRSSSLTRQTLTTALPAEKPAPDVTMPDRRSTFLIFCILFALVIIGVSIRWAVAADRLTSI